MSKGGSLICEECEKACRTRLPHPTKKLRRNGVGHTTYETPALICLRCVDKLQRAAGAPPKSRAKPVESLELFPGYDCVKKPKEARR